MPQIALPAVLGALALAGCATLPAPLPAPQEAFWSALSSHCGKAYAGQLVSTEAVDADMAGQAMIMHVSQCNAERIAIPFHVLRADGSWDRSRTWLITRTPTGLRLKHDHRHEDGSADAVTLYGGDTASAGTARAQDFPVDAESIAAFRANGLDRSVTNVWRVEVDPAGTRGATFAYQLTRAAPNDRLFRVEFAADRPVAPPPAAWGW